jgi:hypothetical protein
MEIMMNALSLTHIYRIRPDIFIKSSTDRVHISYQSRHFILKMGANVIASLLEFLDKNDGSRPLKESLMGYAEQQQNTFIKFLDFLVQKGAAIKQDPDVANKGDLSAVADTITYLAEYHSDPAQRYLNFASQRLLIVGDGYALLSATKTLARMGVKKLAIAILPQCGRFHFSQHDLQKAFVQHQRWHDAVLDFVELRGNTSDGHYDNALVCSELAIDSKVQTRLNLNATHVQYGALSARHAFLSCEPIAPTLLAADDQQTQASLLSHLIAGANIAVAWCDHLMGVRAQLPGSYQYYDLHQQSWTKTANQHRLVPISVSQGQADLAADTTLSGQLDQLSMEPLFPIGAFEELTDSATYIKLYRSELRLAGDRDDTMALRKVVAAGFSRKQCQHTILAEIATVHQVWLERGAAQERANFARAASLMSHARYILETKHHLIKNALAEATTAVASSKSEEYLFFCIETSFGTHIRIKRLSTGDAIWPHCLAATAGNQSVFLLFSDELTDADREALWFGLYAALWACQNDAGDTVNKVFLPQSIFPASSGVDNE